MELNQRATYICHCQIAQPQKPFPYFTNSNLNRDSRYLIFLDRIVSEVHLSFSQSFIEDIFRTEIFVFILKLFVVYFDQKEDEKSCHIDLMVVRKQLLFNLIIKRISICIIHHVYLSIYTGRLGQRPTRGQHVHTLPASGDSTCSNSNYLLYLAYL